jgi:hypothetical protein
MAETVRIYFVLLVVGGALWAASAIPRAQAATKRMISVVIALAGIVWLLDMLASN